MNVINRRCYLKRVGLAMAASAFPASLGSSFAAAPSEEPKPTDAERAAMAGIAQQFLEQFKAPGLSVAVARHGQLVYAEAFGLADKAAGEKVTTAHSFRICSVTKPITSAAIFLLLEQGKLKLEDRVFGADGILRADYQNIRQPYIEEITVHHLLTHTAGGWGNRQNDPMFAHARMNHHELIAWTLENRPLEHRPGASYAYSNFGYCILGRVLEKISGKSYEEFISANILTKCCNGGMRLAGNTLAERAEKEVVYYAQKDEDPYGMNVRRMDSHGGWIATPTEVVEFAVHVDGLSLDTNILKPETIKQMTTPSAANPGYASGWQINRVPNWWHTGNLPGAVSLVVRTASGLCWAACSNTRAPGIDLDPLMWKMVRAVPAWKA